MKRLALAVAALASLAAACSPPKYAVYRSVFDDYTASVPWGWKVTAEAQHADFAQVLFVGPFDPDFFLGEPSLSVRWYRDYRAHHLPGGALEMYSGPDDFIRQTLAGVYGRDAVLYGAGRRQDGGRPIIDAPQDLTLKGSGLTAKFFIVMSPAPAPADFHYGLETGADGKPVNMRMHAYAVVPVGEGFYVLCYPATKRGFEKHLHDFEALIGSFRPLTAGPGGPPVRLPARATAAR